MNHKLRIFAAFAAISLISMRSASADVIVLTFEGIVGADDDFAYVGDYYNGGAGGNYGITFSDNALALNDGNFANEPSPDSIMFFLSGNAATMQVAGGFSGGFSFYYSAVNNPGDVTVYGNSGEILASLFLPVTLSDPAGTFSPFFPIGVSFSGIAYSVDFGGAVNQIAFDNITLGASDPTLPNPTDPNAVPDASGTLALMGLGIVGLAAVRRKLR